MRKSFTYFGIVILMLTLLAVGYFVLFYNSYKFQGEGPIKIVYINSFHFENFPLTENNFAAFEEVFEEAGVQIEVRRIDMDTLRNDSEENRIIKVIEAKKLIGEWQPDLIYATDDNAQEYVAVDYIDSDIPIVFSGVNEDVEKYGYEKAKNVAGVLERVHFVEGVNLAKEIYPDIKKIGVIASDYSLWKMVMERMKKDQGKFSEIEFFGWDAFPVYKNYQDKILYYQDKVDALIVLGLVGIAYEDGAPVPKEVFERWTVENNKLPDITFWNFHVAGGTLLSVDVSPSEQGKSAAILAYKILIDGERPSSLEFRATGKSNQFISLARAETLGLKQDEISSVVLINSEVIEGFSWEEK